MAIKCDSCKKVVKENGEAALGCARCSVWRHAKCFQPAVNADMLKILEQTRSLHFICDKCTATKSDPDPSQDKLHQAIDRLTAALVSFEDRLGTLEERVGSVAQSVPTRQQVADLVVDTIERRENRNQLVVCGVVESEVSDAEYMVSLLDEIGAKGCQPAEVYRMGRPSDNPRGTARLIKLRFNRSWQRDNVLANAKKLREKNIYRGVYIRPSHTSRERRKIAVLYDQKREMEQDGGSYAIRRRGAVDDWDVIRVERPTTNHRDEDNDDTWQTVTPRRNPQAMQTHQSTASVNNNNQYNK